MDRYANLFLRHRIAVVLFVSSLSVAAAVGLARLRIDDVPRSFFQSDDADHARLLQLYEDFGSDDNDVVLVLEAEDWFLPESARYLRALVEASKEVVGIERVLALSEVLDLRRLPPRSVFPTEQAERAVWEDARRAALEHPLVRGRLLSGDSRTTLVVLQLGDEALSIERIDRVLSSWRERVHELAKPPGVRLRETGIPSVRVEIYHTIVREEVRFFALGTVICLTLSWLLFRRVGDVLATSVPPIVGAFWSLGFLGLTGQRVDILGAVVPMLVIVIGFTDSVHLMIDARAARRAGKPALEAAADAIRHVGLPCALTSLTTAIGFSSLSVGNIEIIRRFGIMAASSVLFAFLAIITTLPLLVSVLGSQAEPEERARRGPLFLRFSALFAALGVRVLNRPLAVAIAGVAATTAMLLVSMRLVPENRLTETLPRGEALEALRHCEDVFGGILPTYVLVEWGSRPGASPPSEPPTEEVLVALGRVERLMQRVENVHAPFSVRTLLELLPTLPGISAQSAQGLALLPAALRERFYREDLGRALVSGSLPDAGAEVMSTLSVELTSGLRELEALHPTMSFHLTGTDVVARNNVNRMILGLARSLGFAAVLIFAVIALEFRSLRLGLISLLPNVFPLAVVGCVLVLLGLPLQMASAVLFTVLLGLAVDDTIHFLARYRRERREHEPREAIQRSYLLVGRAILVTTVILGAGFGVGATSVIPTTQLFSWLVGVGLIAALVGDLLLLPALLMLFSRVR